MAQKVQVLNTCDIHGESEEATHIEVRLFDPTNGRPKKIDLCDTQYAKLQKALAPFLEKAGPDSPASRVAPSSRRSTGGSKHGSSGSRSDSNDVRAWAVEQGLPVSERGRIPREIKEQYDAAHA